MSDVLLVNHCIPEERAGDVPLVNHCIPEERGRDMDPSADPRTPLRGSAEGAHTSAEGGPQICGHTKNPYTHTKNTAHTLAQEGFAQEEEEVVLRERGTTKTLAEVASILRLPVTPELQRLVEEYAEVPDLSLAGEADRFCEWIADPTRNRRHQPITPGFFRTWIKNEVAALRRKEVEREQLREVVKEQGVGGHNSVGPVDSASHQAVAMAMYPDMSDLSRKYEQMKLELKLKKQMQSKKEPGAPAS